MLTVAGDAEHPELLESLYLVGEVENLDLLAADGVDQMDVALSAGDQKQVAERDRRSRHRNRSNRLGDQPVVEIHEFCRWRLCDQLACALEDPVDVDVIPAPSKGDCRQASSGDEAEHENDTPSSGQQHDRETLLWPLPPSAPGPYSGNMVVKRLEATPSRPITREERWTEVLVMAAIFLVAGLVVPAWSAGPAPRYLLTVAVVDDQTIYLDGYAQHLFHDQAEYDGRVLNDKAPYQSFAVAPFYEAYRLVGGDPFPDSTAENPIEPGVMPGLWWVTLWGSTVPAMALFVLMRRAVRQVYPRWATATASSLAFGTILLPFSSMLFGHVLSAALAFGAWYLLRRGPPSPRTLLVSGIVLGLGIGTEYPIALPALVLLAAVIALYRWGAVPFSAGTVVGTVPLMVYRWFAFGSPIRTAYQGNLPYWQGEGAFGVYNLQAPPLDEIGRALIGNRGLFVVTPIALVAVFGAVVAVSRRTPARTDAVVMLTMLFGLVLVSTGIDGLGGASPGPRYLIPVIPFMALPAAEAWRRFPWAAVGAAILGGAFMVLATITDPLVKSNDPYGPGRWVEWLADGAYAASIPGRVLPDWSLLVTTAVGLLALGVGITRGIREDGSAPQPPGTP